MISIGEVWLAIDLAAQIGDILNGERARDERTDRIAQREERDPAVRLQRDADDLVAVGQVVAVMSSALNLSWTLSGVTSSLNSTATMRPGAQRPVVFPASTQT